MLLCLLSEKMAAQAKVVCEKLKKGELKMKERGRKSAAWNNFYEVVNLENTSAGCVNCKTCEAVHVHDSHKTGTSNMVGYHTLNIFAALDQSPFKNRQELSSLASAAPCMPIDLKTTGGWQTGAVLKIGKKTIVQMDGGWMMRFVMRMRIKLRAIHASLLYTQNATPWRVCLSVCVCVCVCVCVGGCILGYVDNNTLELIK